MDSVSQAAIALAGGGQFDETVAISRK